MVSVVDKCFLTVVSHFCKFIAYFKPNAVRRGCFDFSQNANDFSSYFDVSYCQQSLCNEKKPSFEDIIGGFVENEGFDYKFIIQFTSTLEIVCCLIMITLM